ncbi:type I-C CRISPR-associated protein Cas8c/Csd1 [Aquamicrobium lusatiense]|uniref:type I-C CRISPR-associated protein Cas8c/Csd1 n=1 Tax=Aquamicrobium lusatiense TaxID=89772 RepID=UPI002453E692|nr:type I-C CRISPR-associated protein Cas8c/Csd1 [Aquamicrobium lusatiense]MDH4992923.1 type I-C CRISPR-associated protein Cas8c/Csd1 [Aquamicrobium lusatiense]
MSMIASLVRAYERLPEAPPFGFSSEKIGFCIALNRDGTVAEVVDLRGDDKKRSPRMVLVPQAVKRTVGIAPNFLWDKSAYVLGVTAGEGKRTADEHAKFRETHAEWLSDTDDVGLRAVLRFLESWRPEHFVPPFWPEEMRDQNIVFALAEEYRECFLHDRPVARQAWNAIGAAGASAPRICLVSGERTATVRLHPSIKGVWGAQSSGASLVSFNLDAFTSYGHEQGDNAPVSEAAVFAYTTALNRFLEKDSGHRIQIGDASTVFWADAEKKTAELAESFFAAMFDTGEVEYTSKTEDKLQTKILATQLESIRQGRKLTDVLPQIDPGVRFHVLGLSPNAARLSVRFYWDDDFGQLTANYQKYLKEMAIEPAPDGWPPLWRYLNDLAVLGKRENVPPNLAGDWMRSILTGAPYPLTLLTMALTRIRADGKVNALRAAILKSVLIRNLNMEAPVALDPAYKDNKGYVLGRLFAVYEQVQRAALGRNVNATIKDKFYGSASATPQKVFRTLDAGSQNHFSKIRKQNPGWAVNLERLLASVTDLMDPTKDPVPVSLNSAEQAMFGIGYHHQRSEFFRERDDKDTDPTEADE